MSLATETDVQELAEMTAMQLEQEKNMDFSDAIQQCKDKWSKDQRVETLFPLACLLIKSQNRKDLVQGIRLLQDIRVQPKTDSQMRFDCGYCIATGQFKLAEYGQAGDTVQELLAVQPDNKQVLALQQLIQNKLQQDGRLGLGIAAGVFAGAVLLGAVLMKGGKK
jgi:fission 1 protein|uniref:Mitochondrial fission 1 protein n=1 Tax=Eutreptiella gymnastica TaxID=73025 RepID=A0A7S4CBF4_9EUGL|eukprot:CAMPEP_0174299306 /NCGR_PEP_ID=MMETSP0809-20121228/56326_1 /TAXON_ID=73025 ORGANISM="Eutreptiella gymnastica-like, Strain CCMP1594" /NCGR_SAMPLE_ID=MMETSP0809 /ASSEMBLY_ACC=CAM_ASM_000658 /LENGTH=164 /DNA_ID=CAMNT_0015404385 /DNA_START=26 /DNA_END=520 /DNA_ORIENTATION=+